MLQTCFVLLESMQGSGKFSHREKHFPTNSSSVVTLPDFQFLDCFQMVTKNLQQFNRQLHARQPLFQIETVLSAPEIVLSPPANEIYKLIMQSIRDMVEG